MRQPGDPGPRENRVRWTFGGAIVVFMIAAAVFDGRPVWVWWSILAVTALVGFYSLKLARQDDDDEEK